MHVYLYECIPVWTVVKGVCNPTFFEGALPEHHSLQHRQDLFTWKSRQVRPHLPTKETGVCQNGACLKIRDQKILFICQLNILAILLA